MKQLSLFRPKRKNTKAAWIENAKVYGGALNYRKCKRPLDSKKLTHVVFKGNLGRNIFFTKSQKSISGLLSRAAKRYQLNLRSFSIQKDHIHVLCYGKGSSQNQRQAMSSFLRFFAAEMGRKYKQIFKRLGITKKNSLWAHSPFTRLVSWGRRSLDKITEYIRKNDLEALGVVGYVPRLHRLSRFLERIGLVS